MSLFYATIQDTTEIVFLTTIYYFQVGISWLNLMKMYTEMGTNWLSKLLFMHLQETMKINSNNHTNDILTLILSCFSLKVTWETPQTNIYVGVHIMKRVNCSVIII